MSVDRIIADTNVLVAAIRSRDGAARAVLRRCLLGEAQPLIGNALYLEYEDVIARDDLFAHALIDPDERHTLLDAFLGRCTWINVSFLWRPNLRDEADNHLIELAVAGNAQTIVTHNRKDFAAPELTFDHVQVLTPAAYLNGLAL